MGKRIDIGQADAHARVNVEGSLALFTFLLLLLFFTLLNGYVLNLVSGYQANTWLVLAGLVVEAAITFFAARRLIRVEIEPLELVGFVAVVLGVWAYFVSAALPTLLPPTQSVDAVRHYQQALFSYPKGTLVSWYPAGGAFLVAMLSHWTGIDVLYVLHPMAAAAVALSAGAVYGITCGLLPRRPLNKVAALLAPALLFVPWSYFAGSINGEQYFYAQVVAQLFVVAGLWYLMRYAGSPHWSWLALLGAVLLGIVACYPYLLPLPLALFAVVILACLRAGNLFALLSRRALVAAGIFVVLLIGAALALQQGGILELKTFFVATQGGVGDGGVTNPSLETLGGPLFLLLAGAGAGLAWRAGPRGKTLVGFIVAWLFQLAALLILQPLLQVSGYRVDKTVYVLVYPLAILATLWPAWIADRWGARITQGAAKMGPAFVATFVLLVLSVMILRPPQKISPLTPSELASVLWARDHLDTYRVSVLDANLLRAYWIAPGLWRETLPNEWFQWIPAGPKLGPATLEEWRSDPAWPPWLLVGDVTRLPGPLPEVVYRSGTSAILYQPRASAAAPVPQHRMEWQFYPMLKLLGYDLEQVHYAPGETLKLATYTESLTAPMWTVGWRVELVDRAGQVVSKASGDPFGNKYPLQRWPPEHFAKEEWNLPLDPSLAPGLYELRLGLYRRSDGEAIIVRPLAVDGAIEWQQFVPLGRIKIPAALPSAEELKSARPLQARLGSVANLLGYTLVQDRAGRTIQLTLYWQSLARTEMDYAIFVHLLDPSGTVVAQKDAEPIDGAYPTSAWDPGEIVKTEYRLTWGTDVQPSAIEIGMYSQADQRRLQLGDTDSVMVDLGN